MLKTRLEEVQELLKQSKESLDYVIIQIENANTLSLYKEKFSEFDQKLERYAQLRIEESELLKVAKKQEL